MIRVGIILFFFIIIGCQRHSKYEVISTKSQSSNEEALNYLNDIIEAGETNHLVYYKRAEVNEKLQNFSKALVDIQKSLELDPTYKESYLLLSKIQLSIGDVNESVNAALQAEQRGLRNYELYKLLAINYLELGQTESAEKSIQRLLDFNYSAENLSLKGDIYLQLTDTATAIESYKVAIKNNPDLSRPYKSLYQLFKTSNPSLAETYIRTYLARNDMDFEFSFIQADFYASRQSYDSAIEIYSNLKSEVDQSKELINNLSGYYYELNKYDTALLLAKASLLKDSVTNRNAKLIAARTFNKLNEYNDSKLYYESIIKNDTTDVIALDELDKLNRKVAYLWRLKQQEKAFDSIRTSAPPVVERKDSN